MKKKKPIALEPQSEPKKKRTRLLPEVRRQQILDAALIEFSALGFTGASIAKIAERAGISKANVYVHFASKDDMFETLLEQLMSRSERNWSQLQHLTTADELIECLIDFAYSGLTDDTIAIARLLIAEGYRVPHLLAKWGAKDMHGRMNRQALIDGYVADGILKSSPLTDHFSMVMAPVVYSAVVQMVMGKDKAQHEIEAVKYSHRQLLALLLRPNSGD